MKLCARAHAQEEGPKGGRRVLQGMGLEGEGLKLVYSTVWCSVKCQCQLINLARSIDMKYVLLLVYDRGL